MSFKTVVSTILLLFSWAMESQSVSNVNPNGKWYFGAEIGTNKIRSYNEEKNRIAFQGGVMAEYYFGRHWSVVGKLKYFETGVSFSVGDSHNGGWFDFGSDAKYGTFHGAVLILPINLKWEFRIYKNLGGSLKMGGAFTQEIKSDYSNYSPNISTSNPKLFGSFTVGYGINYFISPKIAVYVDIELYIGQSKASYDSLFGRNYFFTENYISNFGIKYNFKK